MRTSLRRAAALLAPLGAFAVVTSSLAMIASPASASGGSILIPAVGTSGPAGPYPSTVAVTAPAGEVVLDVNVRLTGFSHTWPSDVDIVLVAPDGETNAVVLGRAGGGTDVQGVDLVIDDEAATAPPVPLVAGSYRPASGQFGSFPPPGPSTVGASGLDTFDGLDPNGTWSLYARDRATGDAGSLADWSLELTTGDASELPDPPAVVIPLQGLPEPYPSTRAVTAPAGEVVTDVDVQLTGLSHESVSALAVLLVAPDGTTNTTLMDRVGGTRVEGVDVHFDDEAAAFVPSPLVSGTYRPTRTNVGSSTFPAPAPVPARPFSLANFNGIDPNGDWSLYVLDRSSFASGELTDWSLSITTGQPSEVEPPPMAAGSILIPDDGRSPFVQYAWPADPYPSTEAVTGPEGEVVADVNVRLQGLSHSCVDDIDVMLVAPDGTTNTVLLSDVGGCRRVEGVDLTIDDEAPASFTTAAVASGAYQPTNVGEITRAGSTDPFPAPAPAYRRRTGLDNLDGVDPNGTWSLYIVDDWYATADDGWLEGWSLEITTAPPSEVHPPVDVAIPATGTSGPADQYPWTRQAAAPFGAVTTDVDVQLTGLSHGCIGDLDLLLVGPDGRTSSMLLSDAPGCNRATSDLDLLLDDEAPPYPSLPTPPPPGSYRYQPVDVDAGGAADPFPAPAPEPPATAALANFDGIDPTGTWSIHALDDALGDIGSIQDWGVIVSFLAPPSEVTGTPVSARTSTVSFTPGTGDPATAYTVRCVSSDGGVTVTAEATASPVVVTGLTPVATYRCQGSASNAEAATGFGELGPAFLSRPGQVDVGSPR